MVEYGSLASLVITSNLIAEITKAQLEDKGMMKLRARINEDKLKCFKLELVFIDSSSKLHHAFVFKLGLLDFINEIGSDN